MKNLIEKIRKARTLKSELNSIEHELNQLYSGKEIILNHDKYINTKVKISKFDMTEYHIEVEIKHEPEDKEDDGIAVEYISLAYFRDGRFKMCEEESKNND